MGFCLGVLGEFKSALKIGDILVVGVIEKFTCEFLAVLIKNSLDSLLCDYFSEWGGLFLDEVLISINEIGIDVTNTLLILTEKSIEDDDISWDHLIFCDLDDITNSYIFPFFRSKISKILFITIISKISWRQLFLTLLTNTRSWVYCFSIRESLSSFLNLNSAPFQNCSLIRKNIISFSSII